MCLVLALLFCQLQVASMQMHTQHQTEYQTARLHESVTLNCTFNCSNGFTRGYWKWDENNTSQECQWENKPSGSGSGGLCTVSLHTPRLSIQQTRYRYSCFSEDSEQPGLPIKTERVVILQIKGESEDREKSYIDNKGLSLTVKSFRGEMVLDEVVDTFSRLEVNAGTAFALHCISAENCEAEWVGKNSTRQGKVLQWGEIREEDGGHYECQAKETCLRKHITVEIVVITSDDLTGAKIFAVFALSALVVLIVTLLLLCYKKACKMVNMTNVNNERVTSRTAVTMRAIDQDSQSDHEVSYADIVISIRGTSSPDLSDTSQAEKNPRAMDIPRWREEGRPGWLHASADRLHIHTKEVTRKLSTASEYAVITYSCETLT